MKTAAEVTAELYRLYDSGKMPVALTMNYSTYLELMKDVEFVDKMYYDEAGNSFDGLPVSFVRALWPGEVNIQTRERLHGE